MGSRERRMQHGSLFLVLHLTTFLFSNMLKRQALNGFFDLRRLSILSQIYKTCYYFDNYRCFISNGALSAPDGVTGPEELPDANFMTHQYFYQAINKQ